MERIIDGRLFEGKRISDSWEVRIWEQNGHREISASNVIQWVEVGAAPSGRPEGLLPGSFVLDRDELARLVAREKADAEERRLGNLKRNANRAKTMCRRIIKAEGFDELLTLTYRENQTDRTLCKRHFEEWVRRMKRHLGGVFRYCASFEVQKRGAMHVHLAVLRLPKHAVHKGAKIEGWRLGTAVWQSVVGDDNGMCFVGGKNRHGNQKRKPVGRAKMAAYVSKYIMKDYADAEAASNRYSRSNGIPVGKPQVLRFDRAMLSEIIGMVFTLGEGDVVVDHSASEEWGRYWLCTEQPGRRRDVDLPTVDLAARREVQIAQLMAMRGEVRTRVR